LKEKLQEVTKTETAEEALCREDMEHGKLSGRVQGGIKEGKEVEK
jgi:hypothetical protein